MYPKQGLRFAWESELHRRRQLEELIRLHTLYPDRPPDRTLKLIPKERDSPHETSLGLRQMANALIQMGAKSELS